MPMLKDLAARAGVTRVIAPCADWTYASGGVRKIYRHVDVLNSQGVPAVILHQQPGFRCTWFENQTPVVSQAQVWPPKPGELLLVPEILAWQMISVSPGVRKVIFNQNAYQTFASTTPELQQGVTPYRHRDFLATIVVSEDSRHYLNHAFPEHPVHRIHNSIDPALFHYGQSKKPRIVFMPRKKKEDAVQILNLLRFRGALEGFEVTAIANMSEVQTAGLLRESIVFMSLCTYEGSPMPPLEAMACGCLTVGYQGRGGAEYVNSEYAIPVEAEDIIGYTRTMEATLKALRGNPKAFEEKTRRASEFVLANYTPGREVGDIVEAWTRILQALASISA